jgi:hypothetical protein
MRALVRERILVLPENKLCVSRKPLVRDELVVLHYANGTLVLQAKRQPSQEAAATTTTATTTFPALSWRSVVVP